jgi:hypothetical protein
MKKLAIITSAILLVSLNSSVLARDTHHDFQIAPVMSSDKAKSSLSGTKFYFGDQKHGKVSKRFGVFSTNKKTNAFGKSDQEACEHVFLSAMIQLKQRADSLGANAVINIKSNYKNNLTSSTTTFKCGAGAVIAGVALQGEMVTLK